MNHPDPHKIICSKTRQQGVVLVITLIVLIAMTLATIALVRSVDTGNVVAGNMAYKQGATQAGDAGTEAALTWLQGIAGVTASYNDSANNGYYASSMDMDMTGNSTDPNRMLVDWDFNNCNGAVANGLAGACITPAPSIDAGNGNQVSYIIHRLCLFGAGQSPNTLGNNCATTSSTIAGTSSGEKNYTTKGGLSGTIQVEYYRITTRVKGPRNTISYIETLVHF